MPVYKDSEMIGRYYTNFTIKGGRSNLTQLFIKDATTFIQDQVHTTPMSTGPGNTLPVYMSTIHLSSDRREIDKALIQIDCDTTTGRSRHPLLAILDP